MKRGFEHHFPQIRHYGGGGSHRQENDFITVINCLEKSFFRSRAREKGCLHFVFIYLQVSPAMILKIFLKSCLHRVEGVPPAMIKHGGLNKD